MNTNAQNLTHDGTNGASLAPTLTLDVTLDVGATLAELTARQLQMLSLATAGLTNQQIADRLGVALSTVANTLRQTYAKINCKNRVLAARWLIEQVGEEA